MNKVYENANKERNIQIYRASKKMFKETKLAKVILYIVNFLPLIILFTQDYYNDNQQLANLIKFSSSAVSLVLNILTELISNIIANHKEEAVLVTQLFETEITGGTLSKMEYDREIINELYELSIRKGTLKREKKFSGAYNVPQEIDDKYSYLFINRYIAAETRYLLGKLQILYGSLITIIAIAFIFWLSNMNMSDAVYYMVCFWSVFIPIVRNFTKCQKNKKQCVKISADIDNFFADGDDSKERLSRFKFYIQSLSFEMRNNLVIIPTLLKKICSFQIKVLDVGVTNRFIEAIYSFEDTILQKKGIKTSKRKFEWIVRDTKETKDETSNEIIDVTPEEIEKTSPKKLINTKSKATAKSNEEKISTNTKKSKVEEVVNELTKTKKQSTTKPKVYSAKK